MYLLLIPQSFLVFSLLGGVSSRENPAVPADHDGGHWEPENRLFRMLFSVSDITMAYFYITVFYQTVRVLKEGHEERTIDPFLPVSMIARWLRNLIAVLVLAGYFGSATIF